jgi:hypothetical protein
MSRHRQPQKKQRRNRSPLKFKKSDARRAIQAALDCEMSVARIEIDLQTGVIALIPRKPGESAD